MQPLARDGIIEEPSEGHELLHDREYRVRAFRTPGDDLLLRGAVRDQKPPGLYLADDPDPMTVHHMQVDLHVGFPALEITDVAVAFETHPEPACPSITEHYEKLVGLSIARGFTGRVRELFGGPRGCTHVTALLNAMAPVAVQCFWSMAASESRRAGTREQSERSRGDLLETRKASLARNINSCHVWREDGEVVVGINNGVAPDPPLFMQERLRSMGKDPSDWAL